MAEAEAYSRYPHTRKTWNEQSNNHEVSFHIYLAPLTGLVKWKFVDSFGGRPVVGPERGEQTSTSSKIDEA